MKSRWNCVKRQLYIWHSIFVSIFLNKKKTKKISNHDNAEFDEVWTEVLNRFMWGPWLNLFTARFHYCWRPMDSISHKAHKEWFNRLGPPYNSEPLSALRNLQQRFPTSFFIVLNIFPKEPIGKVSRQISLLGLRFLFKEPRGKIVLQICSLSSNIFRKDTRWEFSCQICSLFKCLS